MDFSEAKETKSRLNDDKMTLDSLVVRKAGEREDPSGPPAQRGGINSDKGLGGVQAILPSLKVRP